MIKPFPTAKQLGDLADRLRDAYREECAQGECQCVTVEEHERSLAGAQPTHPNQED